MKNLLALCGQLVLTAGGVFLADAVAASETTVSAVAEILSVAEKAYTARAELLEHSKGQARFRMSVTASPERVQKLRSRIQNELSMDPSRVLIDGQAEWTLSWQQSGNRIRFDKEVLPNPPDIQPLTPPEQLRVVFDPEKSFYYSPRLKEAYINKRRTRLAANPRAYLTSFDIRYFYKFEQRETHELLKVASEVQEGRFAESDEVDGVPCFKYGYVLKDSAEPGRIKEKQLSLWISPAQSFSLLKAEFLVSGYDAETGENRTVAASQTFRGRYVEAESHPGIWLLSELDLTYMNRGPQETFHASFDYDAIGAEIEEEVFTFDGLAVPHGTPVYDMRLGGEALEFVYNGNLVPDVNAVMKIDAIVPKSVEDTLAKPGAEISAEIKHNSGADSPDTTPTLAVAEGERVPSASSQVESTPRRDFRGLIGITAGMALAATAAGLFLYRRRN